MAYQIPQQLAYKEKIMFGLTFKQLAYAFGAGFLDLICFRLIENPYLRYIPISIISFLGILLIFCDLDDQIKTYFNYFKFRGLKKDSSGLTRFLGVEGIQNKELNLKNNKKVAILKIIPINFTIKTKEERKSIMIAFQKFLNSLDFPIQILMHTENVNLRLYFKILKNRIKDERSRIIYNSYRKHIISTLYKNKIKNRVFYLIVPEKDDLEIQIEICIDRLRSLGLKSKRLDDDEIEKLLKNFFAKNYRENGKRKTT